MVGNFGPGEPLYLRGSGIKYTSLFNLSTGLAVLMYLEYFLSIVLLAFTNSDFVFAVIMGHTLSRKTFFASPILIIFLYASLMSSMALKYSLL